MSVKITSLQALMATVLGVVCAAPAWAVPVDWTNSFLFRGAGFENPLVRVGFNPQPEPPAGGLLSFLPGDDGYPPDPIITHGGISPQPFRLLFGIATDEALFVSSSGLVGDYLYVMKIADALGADAFLVEFEMSTSSGGSPVDLVGFNPQPDPPGLNRGGANFGLDFAFSSYSDATLRLRIVDANGAPIALTRVPEPATVALVIGGVALLGSRRRRRRHSAVQSA